MNIIRDEQPTQQQMGPQVSFISVIQLMLSGAILYDLLRPKASTVTVTQIFPNPSPTEGAA